MPKPKFEGPTPDYAQQEREKPTDRLLEALRDLAKERGFSAAKAVATTITEAARNGDVPSREALLKTVENFPEREKFQQEIFAYLRERNLLEERPNGVLIIDPKIFEKRTKDAMLKKIGERMGTTPAEKIGNLFVGKKVVLRVVPGTVTGFSSQKPKELFYSPESKKDAFDLAKIRAADFHFGLWEKAEGLVDKKDGLVGQPGAVDNLSLLEASVACLIFHPAYGAGHRDASGRLMVKPLGGGEPVLFTNLWLRQQPGMRTRVSGDKIFADIFFSENQRMARELLTSGLLQRRDFARTKEVRAKNVLVGSNGMVSINSVHHYFGRQYSGCRVEPVGEKLLAAIATGSDGQETVVATCRKFSKDAPGLKQRKTGTGVIFDASTNLCQPTAFETTDPHLAGESDDPIVRSKQLGELVELQTVLNFDNLLLRRGVETRIREAPTFLQEKIKKHSKNLAENFPQAMALVEKYGQVGLEMVGASIDTPQLFREVVQLTETVELNEEGKKILAVVQENLRLKLAVDLLVEAFDEEEKEPLLELLISLNIVTFLLVRLIKSFYKSGAKKLKTLSEQLSAEGVDLIIEKKITTAVVGLSSFVGVEKLRLSLQEAVKKLDPSLRSVFESMLRIMSPETPDSVKTDLRDLYAEIKFEEYKLNETSQRRDEEVLRPYIKAGDAVVDLGAGTGRLTKPMVAAGATVTAIDNVSRHVSIMHREIPEATVVKADWIKTGLTDESQDVVCSLGRSILHEFEMTRQNALFAEVSRILKPGGTFILDIPDRTTGNYLRLVESYKETMQKRGINVREGLIYDSPDGEHFFTRYAYSERDIRTLAEVNGLEVVSSFNYSLGTTEGDQDIYFVMKKKPQPKTQEVKI